MNNFLKSKGPRWIAIAANVLVLAVYGLFAWGWFAQIGDMFILIGPLGFLGLGIAILWGIMSLVLTVVEIAMDRKSGESAPTGRQSVTLALSLLPIVLIVIGYLLVRLGLGF